MEDRKYVCPLCGKKYSSADELAKCVSKDAAAIKAKEEEISKKKEETKILKDKLDSIRSELIELNYKMNQKVNEFNAVGRKLCFINPNEGAHCTYSISFNEEDSKVDEKEIAKTLHEAFDYIYSDERLTNLINSIL